MAIRIEMVSTATPLSAARPVARSWSGKIEEEAWSRQQMLWFVACLLQAASTRARNH